MHSQLIESILMKHDMSNEAKLGEFLYLAMGECNGHKVVMGVGYTSEYADKKAKQFQEASDGKIKIYRYFSGENR